MKFGNFNAHGWQFKGNNVQGMQWAPDIVYNKTMKKWCMYMSLNGANWCSSIVCFVSDNIEGPWVYQGPVVFSGFQGTYAHNSYAAADDWKHTDFAIATGETALPSRYKVGDKWGTYWPNCIERINCTNGNVNWGIGIGLAGSTYDNTYPDDLAIKNFVVANITGTDCRQLVHVENGKHFIIRNITTRNITPDFSKKAGIDNATVAIYGCDNFVIDNIDMENSAGMLIGYGVIKGRYLSIPQNFKLNNIHLDNTKLEYKLRGIQISSGNATSFVAITNVEMKRATLELHNQPQHLFLRNIRVMQQSVTGPALKMHFDLRKDVRGKFMAKQDTLLSLANVHAVNETGQSSVDIDRINHQVVNVEAVNFRLPGKGG